MPVAINVTIVGVGLIGGSIGLALRERKLANRVVGCGRRQQSLNKALAVGAIDEASTDITAAVADAEIVVVASPVASVVDHVCRVAESCRADLITDVGSTKGLICRQIEKQLSGSNPHFVGSHPLAGDHRTGPENARADLFVDRTVVVTPSEQTPDNLTQRAAEFWRSLGAKVVEMGPEEHDQAVGATSHLPHLVASALAACTPHKFLPLAATGWADTTRVAAGDPELWTQIFSQNAPAVINELDNLMEQLVKLRGELASSDWQRIQETLEKAKQVRDALGI
ncbi:prephenate dehydrogenase [Bythopirellula polymerisocia]|uniref:Prephenate dehydrogenase n=1 Tax=Bythopirellula polymerisocia TaxID=2528003 RepID=A0A5C6CLF3_9BACT|nr:prephenate dehydrogenase/arogenate dehydrogenase family protein [Bythopirellula polymerisocia]TWU25723.1 prephenate dehydrogenase [Bythopirellula polymerisocia]